MSLLLGDVKKLKIACYFTSASFFIIYQYLLLTRTCHSMDRYGELLVKFLCCYLSSQSVSQSNAEDQWWMAHVYVNTTMFTLYRNSIPTLKYLQSLKNIFETNSSFDVKQYTTRKVQFLFYIIFLLVLT